MRTAADLTSDERFLFFWKPDPGQDKSCLSQWWPSPFEVDGLTFDTAEHHMMWGKATLFGDELSAKRIRAARTPKQAKDLGQQVGNFDQATWDAHRTEIVVTGNVHKFRQHDDLRAFLLSTGDRVLVEASPLDRIWGIGLREDDPRAEDPAQWRGLNLLGFALGEVRKVLALE
jgi:ribA/ribD-fused uncharacterized protein